MPQNHLRQASSTERRADSPPACHGAFIAVHGEVNMADLQYSNDWMLLTAEKGGTVGIVIDTNKLDEDAPTISISRQQAREIGRALIAAAEVDAGPVEARKPAVPWYVVEGYGDERSAVRDGALPPKK